MDEDLPLFMYKPLSSMDHIRVLVLHPGSHDEQIRCDLKEIPLHGAECMYEGISYVWGKNDDVTDIICDGKRHSIKTNLADALRAFRLANEPRSVWADAICINQHDHTEKG